MWCWNVNGLATWDAIASSGIDVALLQEAPQPPATWPGTIVPDPTAGWATAGWKPGRWSRCSAIVQVSDQVKVVPRELGAVGDLDAAAIPVSRPGTLTVADVHFGEETLTVVSMYGGWECANDPRRTLYADAAAHRLLSDLSAIITGTNNHRIIAAGDLNILHRYGEHGDPYWAARYASVFDRAEAMGLQFVGPQAPHGRQADPAPSELPVGSLDVPTYHTSRQGPTGATRQLDFVFASNSIAERVSVRALNDPDGWGPSDHCRLAINFTD
jgi:endonuclease/exonuclease/phosphatase family metal-dependent hydrolase